MRRGLPVINMTNFFNRELFMYSMGDIKFKKPISLKKMVFTLVFFIVWTLPIFFILGISSNMLLLGLTVAPPFILGHYATKPVWGGKSMLDFFKTSINFLSEPKGWVDTKPIRDTKGETFTVKQEIWISRRRELQYLREGDKV